MQFIKTGVGPRRRMEKPYRPILILVIKELKQKSVGGLELKQAVLVETNDDSLFH